MAEALQAEEPEEASERVTIWKPQAGPQTALVQCPVFEVFYGGARGGGKTDGVLGDFIRHVKDYGEHAVGLMVRRERTQLLDTIERSKAIYGVLGAKYHEQDKMWRFANGARLRFAYLERDADADGYQGHSYTRVYVEEIGTFPSPTPILKLMATLRSGAGVPCGMRATGNPGGPGHNWVKERYITPNPEGWEIFRTRYKNPFSGEEVERDRIFIPSRLSDNSYLGPEYVANLQMSGSEQLVRAWLEGDWDIVDGAFFDNWRASSHVVTPFAIPPHWMRFRSMDWGFAAPFSVGWWAVCPDDQWTEGSLIPRGAIVRYREWYGAKSAGVGVRMTAEEVAKGIAAREAGEKIEYGVLDPAAFAQQGGPSIAEVMYRNGATFRRADNTRVGPRGAMSGWNQVRARLNGDGQYPMLFVFSTCKDLIRTLPILQHDPDRPEDVDTEQEDHAADEVRYACLSRPFIPKEKAPPKKDKLIYEATPHGVVANMSIRDIVEAKARRRKAREMR